MKRKSRCIIKRPLHDIALLLLLLELLIPHQSTHAIESLTPRKLFHETYNKATTTTTKTQDDDDDVSDVMENFIDQRLDHFIVEKPPKTYRQRFFYTDRFVVDATSATPNVRGAGGGSSSGNATESGYAFLCVGGEGPRLTKGVLVDSVHCTGDMIELARRLYDDGRGASVHLFALEHRYYGESFPDVTTYKDGANMQYLSSRQALMDIAHFITTMNSNPAFLSSPKNIKWITFGGSYPGVLAGYARYKFPHLVHAAVSNSAPAEMRLAMPEYNDVVAADLAYEKIGGSEECLAIVKGGHEEIVASLATDEGKEEVAKLFNVCGGAKALQNEKNQQCFVGDGVVYIPAQENDPSCVGDLCNIEKICDSLINDYDDTTTSMERLASFASKQNGGQCTKVQWELFLHMVSSLGREAHSWMYQTCTEFGFYQTCEVNSNCPFGRGYHTVDQDLEICQVLFGLEPDVVKQNVQASREYYGGWDMKGSRIFMVNGDVDPWSSLAITGDKGTVDQPTMWVAGASHHFWTHAVKDSDAVEVVEAREKIYSQVKEWIMGEEESSIAASTV